MQLNIDPPQGATEAFSEKEFFACASFLRMSDPTITWLSPFLIPTRMTQEQMTSPM